MPARRSHPAELKRGMATGIRFDVVFGLFGSSAFCDSASLMQVDKNEYSTSSPYELVDEIMMNVGN